MYTYFQHWNQLSRFQRNLILMIILAIGVTVLLLLPDNGLTDSHKNDPQNHIQIAPFKDPVSNINLLKNII